jgi:hypothetical protein
VEVLPSAVLFGVKQNDHHRKQHPANSRKIEDPASAALIANEEPDHEKNDSPLPHRIRTTPGHPGLQELPARKPVVNNPWH